MRLTAIAGIMFIAATTGAFADDDDDKAEKNAKMKFWNLTGEDLVELYMAPAGTDKFGPNQTANDDNNVAESDERLPLTGVTSGTFDVKIKDKAGRTCVVKNVEVRDTGPYSFSLEADQLTDCKP
ncbi:MAG: hypothetical protein JNL45_05955 [Hyphomicrobium sp.]|nr:hypothetical protein [Hyphomicrobium sp.]